MIHDFDYARWIGGEVDRVFARRGRAASSPAQYIQAILRFKSGGMALVEGGWAYPPGVFRTALDVSGTDGLMEWNSDQPLPIQTYFPPERSSVDGVGLPVAELSEDPYTSEIRHAYEVISTGAQFEVTAKMRSRRCELLWRPETRSRLAGLFLLKRHSNLILT